MQQLFFILSLSSPFCFFASSNLHLVFINISFYSLPLLSLPFLPSIYFLPTHLCSFLVLFFPFLSTLTSLSSLPAVLSNLPLFSLSTLLSRLSLVSSNTFAFSFSPPFCTFLVLSFFHQFYPHFLLSSFHLRNSPFQISTVHSTLPFTL